MPIGLPINLGAVFADDAVVEGSIRQRSAGSFELRVFIGIDPDTHRRRYRSMTVRANRAEAERELGADALVDVAIEVKRDQLELILGNARYRHARIEDGGVHGLLGD